MRISDLKQILWWLSGGLLICTGVLVGVILLNPVRSYARRYSLYGEGQMRQALTVDARHQSASGGFEKYEPTYKVKIDGVPPPPPLKPPPIETRAVETPQRPLADFIEVTALWTDVAFYRLKNSTNQVHDVVVGEFIPAQQVPELGGKAKLLRLEFAQSPFRAVFLVHGKEEIFLVPQEAILLGRRPAEKVASAGEEYGGPQGLVAPGVRKVPAIGIKKLEDGSIRLGQDIQEMIRSDSERFFRDVAWDVTKKGLALVKIRKGSRLDLLNRKAGGILKEGDVIVSVNGIKVEGKSQIINHFRAHPVKPGARVIVEILRFGRVVRQTFTAPAR